MSPRPDGLPAERATRPDRPVSSYRAEPAARPASTQRLRLVVTAIVPDLAQCTDFAETHVETRRVRLDSPIDIRYPPPDERRTVTYRLGQRKFPAGAGRIDRFESRPVPVPGTIPDTIRLCRAMRKQSFSPATKNSAGRSADASHCRNTRRAAAVSPLEKQSEKRSSND